MRRLIVLVVIACLIASNASTVHAQVPDCVGCNPGQVTFAGTTYVAAPRGAESGPFMYKVTFANSGTTPIVITVSCSTSGTQLACVAPSPDEMSLDAGETVDIDVGFSTKGLGTFIQTITASDDGGHQAAFVSSPFMVSGAPIAVHVFPFDSASIGSTDTLHAELTHSSGITTGSVVLLIDGVSKTKTVTSTGAYTARVTASGLGLTAGYHKWQTYGCAVNGRCDTTSTIVLMQGAPTTFSLDDSLPSPAGAEPLYGLLPGGLPLPTTSTNRGCPIGSDDPEIRLVSPFSYITQPGSINAPGGFIFMASIKGGDAQPLQIASLTVDHKPADNVTCAGNFPYLTPSQYDWSFWEHSDPDDPMWDSYPYGDLTLGETVNTWEFALTSFDQRLPHGPRQPLAGPVADHRPRGRLFQAIRHWSSRLTSTPRGSDADAPRSAPPIPDPGAINPNTYRVTLNGTTIVNNGNPVDGNITKVALDRYGSTYTIPVADTRLNHFDPLNPTAHNGGWNEMIATISDSTSHSTSVRSRFVVMDRGTKQPITLTTLRDLTSEDQGNCASFGVFQCGGVYLTQSIPGYVSRDKDRALHLVYRSNSQRARTGIPFQMYVDRLQAAPDSLHVRVQVSGVNVGDTLRY
ncbi:MAG: hypothetical protein ABI679_10825, partial [Gemmatimonadota bacterium]